MAIEETVEMCARLETEFALKAQAVLMNLVSPLATISASEIDELRHTDDPALRFAVERGLVERERAVELKKRIPAGQIAVERVRAWSSDLDLLMQIGQSLDGIPTA